MSQSELQLACCVGMLENMMLQAKPVEHPSQLHNFSHSVSHELRAARNDQQRARARKAEERRAQSKVCDVAVAVAHILLAQLVEGALEAARRVDAECLRE